MRAMRQSAAHGRTCRSWEPTLHPPICRTLTIRAPASSAAASATNTPTRCPKACPINRCCPRRCRTVATTSRPSEASRRLCANALQRSEIGCASGINSLYSVWRPMGSTRLRQGPQSGISWRSTLLGLVLGVALLAAAPSVAAAALSVSGSGLLNYTARTGDTNDISISFNGTDYVVTDVVPIDVSTGCLATGPNGATCSGVSSIRVNAGDGNDQVTIDPGVTVPTSLFGREGDDVLVGGSGPDILNGFTGNDTLVGGDGTDTVDYSSSPPGSSVHVDLFGGQGTGVGTDH